VRGISLWNLRRRCDGEFEADPDIHHRTSKVGDPAAQGSHLREHPTRAVDQGGDRIGSRLPEAQTV
jgi:hypothetical protein